MSTMNSPPISPTLRYSPVVSFILYSVLYVLSYRRLQTSTCMFQPCLVIASELRGATHTHKWCYNGHTFLIILFYWHYWHGRHVPHTCGAWGLFKITPSIRGHSGASHSLVRILQDILCVWDNLRGKNKGIQFENASRKSETNAGRETWLCLSCPLGGQ